ncbi:SusC/RagA family TonB-linked outer membrane protein [Wenyingzhuangia sp. 2_MG-2023]|uniref:SusC/RagA family TonB-linked outer membrane protein n=1 Tax=Wenyingzhuangia sp. 2_MG-2023 TaxID=3062639 RepID=UPI0026E1A5C1|nr:SusC/RagA family TonB-linked outer membrane protein [Wenyingzhuangia sp. 2_MG-2023]MDO6738946.1 SusC/RagA family TonB-linked outer membrane protein [Wenyingzhuangia sp. 2_MG-2023]
MKLKTIRILLLLIVTTVQFSFAQEKIMGVVTDDSGPIPGATITIKGTSKSTITDFDGNYSITANPGDILAFSYFGMKTEEKTVGIDKTINVTLSEDVESLNEVVVTAMGISKRKRAVGYSIAEFSGEDISKTQAINPVTAVQGKVAGLDISSPPTPGGTQNVIIRGVSSFGNVQPMYIVDGVVLTNIQERGGSSLNNQADFGSGLNAVNPDDIENFTILKGAAATALYGSRAANGVVLITTKSGKDGKLKVNFNSSVSVNVVGFLPERQSQFGQGWSGDRALDENGNWGAAYDGVDRVWGNIVDNSQKIKPYVYLENSLRDFYDVGESYKNSISLSGGDEKNTYFLSASQNSVDGVIPTDNDSYKRYTLSTKASHKTKKLKLSSAMNFSKQTINVVPSGQGTSLSRSLNEIANDISIVDLEDYNDKFNNLDNYFTPYGVNPYYILNNNTASQDKYKFYGKFEVEYNILDNLKLDYRFSGDYESSTAEEKTGIISFSEDAINAGSSTATPGAYTQTKRERVQLSHDAMLLYNQDFTKDLSFSAILGLNVNERSNNWLEGNISSIDVPGFYDLGNTLTPATADQDRDKRRLIGTYASVDLGFKDYLFLNATIRNDWSSTLPKENNSYMYGGVTGSFILSELLKSLDSKPDYLSFSKFRVAYGSTGKDAEPYKVYDRYVVGTSANPGFPDVDDLSFPLGGVNSYTVSDLLGNQELKPEITREFEVGLENRFFRSRIGFELSYYNRFTEGLIDTLPIDYSSGYTQVTSNLGDVRNSGIELNLNFVPVKTKDFRWDMDWAYTKNKNKIEKLDVSEIYLSGFSTVSIYAVEGMAIGQFKSTKPKTVIVDGVESIVVDGAGNPQATTDAELLGKDVNEKFRLGLTNSFTYKGFSLAGTLDLRYGGYIYSGTKDYMHWTGSSPESVLNDRNTFIIPNSVVANADGSYSENSTPVDPTALHTFYSTGGMEGESYAVIDKSYLKLRNVTLGYTIPKSFCDKINVSKINLSLTATNFLLWKHKDNPYIDPETTTFGNNVDAKFGEYNTNPTQQTYTFGVNIQL